MYHVYYTYYIYIHTHTYIYIYVERYNIYLGLRGWGLGFWWGGAVTPRIIRQSLRRDAFFFFLFFLRVFKQGGPCIPLIVHVLFFGGGVLVFNGFF